MAKAICSINSSLEETDSSVTLASLKHSKVSLRSITDDCAQEYLNKLAEAREEKISKGGVTGWAEHRSKEGYAFYYDSVADSHSWVKPDEYTSNPVVLSKEEIQVRVIHDMLKFSFERFLLFFRPL